MFVHSLRPIVIDPLQHEHTSHSPQSHCSPGCGQTSSQFNGCHVSMSHVLSIIQFYWVWMATNQSFTIIATNACRAPCSSTDHRAVDKHQVILTVAMPHVPSVHCLSEFEWQQINDFNIIFKNISHPPLPTVQPISMLSTNKLFWQNWHAHICQTPHWVSVVSMLLINITDLNSIFRSTYRTPYSRVPLSLVDGFSRR